MYAVADERVWHHRRMPVPRKLLIDGEDVVLSLRTHAKAVALPAVVLVAVAGIAGYLTTLVGDGDVARWVTIGIWVVAGLAILVWSVVPLARWLTTTYTVTTKRVLLTSGLITRVGRAIPLHRVNDVQFEKGLVDRMLGCGTLVISDATEQHGMRLSDVPRVEAVHRQLTGLVFGRDNGRDDDGSQVPREPGSPGAR